VDRSASIRLGSYQFSERLGEGGSGQVWRAVGPAGAVAVKVLSPAGELDESARARFRREIAALGQLRHPHLVPLLDSGIDPELGPYLVLPLLPGVTLRELVAGRALCPEAAIVLALPMIEAAAALHAAGYVHRDLKPENAIASPDGAVTVIDLGLAWRDGMTRHTETGAAVGSVGYMAPEQIEGRGVDAAADVWALGVLVYEWIAGKRPFARPRPSEEAAAALVGSCAKLTAADRRTDEALAELLARCLAVDPNARPSAAELAAALVAMIDWASPDALAAERAAVIADPVAYQGRVAPLRIRRLERMAREALDAGRPFAALALCDRGLAYAPDHGGLSALVAEVEAATAGAAPAPSPSPRSVSPTNPPGAPATPPAAMVPPIVTTGGTRTAVPVASVGIPNRGKKVLIGGLAVLGAGGFAFLVYMLSRREEKPEPDAWSNRGLLTTTTTTTSGEGTTQEGMALARGLLSVFDRAMTADEERRAAAKAAGADPGDGPVPINARGWLELAEKQQGQKALASVRQALSIDPMNTAALAKRCELVVRLGDPSQIDVCVDATACADTGDCAGKPLPE
jgi:hypothetical protein